METSSVSSFESQVSPQLSDDLPEGESVNISDCGPEFIHRLEAQMQPKAHSGKPVTEFRSTFTDCMEMYADAATVAKYLDSHQSWFRRCAAPMEAESIGDTGYALSLGRFGSLGYNIEPKIGLDLLPQDAGVYRIRTIEVPDYHPVGYEVDFQASLELNEHDPEDANIKADRLTRVEWILDLGVAIEFPRFISALPKPMIKGTGDRLLHQIVRQISRRLTHKVQEDFHSAMGLPGPAKK
jgi:hypothetical protein